MLDTIKLKKNMILHVVLYGCITVKGRIQAEGAGEQYADKFIWT